MDKLFDLDSAHCEHGRSAESCPFCKAPKLARRNDPRTSKAAARSLTHELTDRHWELVAWLRDHGPATEDQIAQAMFMGGKAPRAETARRWVRTLREKEIVAPAYDDDGHQIVLENDSGRQALAWIVGPI